MALYGRQYTVTAAAVAALAAASGVNRAVDFTSPTRPGRIQIQEISFKCPTGNAGPVYIGNSDVTAVPANALIEIPAGVGFTCGPFSGNAPVYADDFFVVGTANDRVFIYVTPY